MPSTMQQQWRQSVGFRTMPPIQTAYQPPLEPARQSAYQQPMDVSYRSQQATMQRSPMSVKPSGAGTSNPLDDHPAPAGPVETRGSIWGTILTIGIVGGMFLFVTSGPSMAPRRNPSDSDDDG